MRNENLPSFGRTCSCRLYIWPPLALIPSHITVLGYKHNNGLPPAELERLCKACRTDLQTWRIITGWRSVIWTSNATQVRVREPETGRRSKISYFDGQTEPGCLKVKAMLCGSNKLQVPKKMYKSKRRRRLSYVLSAETPFTSRSFSLPCISQP